MLTAKRSDRCGGEPTDREANPIQVHYPDDELFLEHFDERKLVRTMTLSFLELEQQTEGACHSTIY